MEVGLPVTMVEKVYKSYWRAVREHISSLPLKEKLAEKDFARLQPNINIPSIGKLYVTSERYKSINNKYKYYKERINDSHKES